MDCVKKRKCAGAFMGMMALAVGMLNADNGMLRCTAVAAEHDKKRKRDMYELDRNSMNTMRNLFENTAQAPRTRLQPKFNVREIIDDPGRNYMKMFTSLYTWEFFALAELLKNRIEANRQTKYRENPKTGRRRKCKFDYIHRLFFALQWLKDGREFKKMESDFGWSASCFQEDIPHVLRAIVQALDEEVKWPDVEERAELGQHFGGIFSNCIGIVDGWECQINKPKDELKETLTYSGKAKNNTKKVLAVIDYRGYFIYARADLDGHNNDRTCFTSSELYLNKGAFFSANQWLAADGIFDGDGNCGVSYSALQINNNAAKKYFNLTFTEMRKGVENAFGRVQMWFPLLKNKNAEWNYNDDLLATATLASIRLHNYMLRNRGLDYDAAANSTNLFRDHF